MRGRGPRASVPAIAALLFLPLTPAASAQTSCPAVELRYDEHEQLAEKRSDTNQDCRHDEFVYYFN